MRILQVFNADTGRNGAAIAMERLHNGLRESSVDSRVLYGRKRLGGSYSTEIGGSNKLESLIWQITWRLGLNEIHRINSFGIRKMKIYTESDLLHSHSMHGGYFSYLALPALTRDKIMVFTAHDMYNFTGHCAYSYDCQRWKTGCGKCPYPEMQPAIKRDNTRLEWRLKNWIYNRSNLAIVVPSKWLSEQAKQSMLNRFPIHHIPNAVDTKIYKPLDPELCRYVLGIPTNKMVLMFIAWKIGTNNKEGIRKGTDLLIKALNDLPKSLKSDLVLLLVGDVSGNLYEEVSIETINLGYISSDRIKAVAYSASDIFIHPTRADNMPLTLIESLACGTPIVSFNVGGVPDLVRHGITGYLAEPENAEDFCNSIVELLEDESLRAHMAEQCRSIALDEYSIELHVQRHIELYRQLLKN